MEAQLGKGVSVENGAQTAMNSQGRQVKRYSLARLLRERLSLPGDVTLSAEQNNGRLLVCIEMPTAIRDCPGNP